MPERLNRVLSLRDRSYNPRRLRDFRPGRKPLLEARAPWPKAWRRPGVPGARGRRRDPSRHTRFRRQEQIPETSRNLRDEAAVRVLADWLVRGPLPRGARRNVETARANRQRREAEARALFQARRPQRCRGTNLLAESRNGCAPGHDPLAKSCPEFRRPQKSLRRGPQAGRSGARILRRNPIRRRYGRLRDIAPWKLDRTKGGVQPGAKQSRE